MEAHGGTAWGPLAPAELGRVLLMAAEVADSDPDHDLLTALDVLNKDKLGPAGEPRMYEAELRQIARALHAEVPAGERVGGLGSDVVGVNAWLGQRVRARPHTLAGGSALAALFRQAEARIERARDGECDA